MTKGFGSRMSRIKTPTLEFDCAGGPLNGKTLALTSSGTLPFRWGGSGLGRYVPHDSRGLRWEKIPIKVPCPCCGTIVDEEKVK